ncbi:MAG: ABC transporter substrate-binding protein [Chloroflexota bacterium]
MRTKFGKAFNAGMAAVFAVVALAVSANHVASAYRAHSTAKAGLQTLRLGYLENNPKWVPTMDPAQVEDTNSAWVDELVYAGLVALKPNGSVYAYLASHWTISKDGKTYTFYIRPTAKFSDGHQITAQDVVFSVRRANSKATNSSVANYDNLIVGWDKYNTGKSSSLGIKALNKSTVQIKLKTRAAYFLAAFTYEINNVLEQRVVKNQPTGLGGPYLTTSCKANVASGPFKPVCHNGSTSDVTSFYPGGSTPTITLVPNSHFFGKKAHIKIVIPAIDSNQTGYTDLLAGGLDMTPQIPTSYITKWQGKKGFIHYPSSFIEYLSLNAKDPPFNNVHCRLAMAYAIDKVTLTQKVLHKAYVPLYGMLPRAKGFIGNYSESGLPHYSLAKSKSELAQCPGGIHVTYIYRTDTTDRKVSAAALQAMWSAAGIDVKLKGLLRADWLKIIVDNTPLSKTHTDMAYDDWSADYIDPQDYMYFLFHSGLPQAASGWDNLTYDKLVDKADSTLSRTQRVKLYTQAQKLLVTQASAIPIDNVGNNDLVKSNVHGFVGNFALGVSWAKNNDWSQVGK